MKQKGRRDVLQETLGCLWEDGDGYRIGVWTHMCSIVSNQIYDYLWLYMIKYDSYGVLLYYDCIQSYHS